MMSEDHCQKAKKDNAPACIPFFAHENTVTHMNICNRRMLVALVCVCVTFIITIVVFTCGYTVREKNWLDTIERISPGVEVGVGEGVHQQPDS